MTTAAARRPRRRNRELTRAALLEAAADVFARCGFDGATLEGIADVAGFTRGAVYHHFASKEQLFLAVIAAHDEALLAGYGADVLGSMPPDAAAAAARWRTLHEGDGREVALRLELRSHALRNERLRAELLAVDRAAVAATAARLSALDGCGDVPWPYPTQQVAELFHLVSRAALERTALTGEDMSPVMKMLLELVWGGSVTHEDGGR